MSARNIHHHIVREALIADGWTITADPLRLQFGGRDVLIDLAAEDAAFSAEKAGQRIAVEVQSFRGPSDVRNLEEALGQFMLYRFVLSVREPDRKLLMAVESEVYNDFLSQEFGRTILSAYTVPLIVFDVSSRRVTRWIN
jgi:hypothetical protein